MSLNSTVAINFLGSTALSAFIFQRYGVSTYSALAFYAFSLGSKAIGKYIDQRIKDTEKLYDDFADIKELQDNYMQGEVKGVSERQLAGDFFEGEYKFKQDMFYSKFFGYWSNGIISTAKHQVKICALAIAVFSNLYRDTPCSYELSLTRHFVEEHALFKDDKFFTTEYGKRKVKQYEELSALKTRDDIEYGNRTPLEITKKLNFLKNCKIAFSILNSLIHYSSFFYNLALGQAEMAKDFSTKVAGGEAYPLVPILGIIKGNPISYDFWKLGLLYNLQFGLLENSIDSLSSLLTNNYENTKDLASTVLSTLRWSVIKTMGSGVLMSCGMEKTVANVFQHSMMPVVSGSELSRA